MSHSKIVLRPAASTNRRQPLLLQQSVSSKGAVVGEVIGGTTAECVAVCCCCPCGLVFNILLLTLYKVPLGLCRRMLRRWRRRKMIKERMLPLPTSKRRHHCSCGCCDVNGLRIVHPMCANDNSDIKQLHSFAVQPDKDALALEKEMWDRFYGTGFWRSSSRREPSNDVVVPGTQLPFVA